jgi:hypothetical protein
MHHYGAADLRWDGNQLRLPSGRVLATIEPDTDWPGLWRVHLPGAGLSDLVNRTRAKDAAVSLALASLNRDLHLAA